MKTVTIREAKGQLEQLIAEAHRGDVIVLTDGDKQVWLDTRSPLELDEDSPELEVELLKAVKGPHAPLLEGELRAMADQALREMGHHKKP